MQDADGNYKIPLDEVQTIKGRLIGLMIASPANIQSQLGEAVSIIADSDFWERWDTLTHVTICQCELDRPIIYTDGVVNRTLSAVSRPPIPR